MPDSKSNFDKSLPMMLHRSLDAIMPAFRELFSRYDLTDQQWRVLRVLWASHKVTSAELSRRTLLPGPSLVGIIDRLVSRDLVTRVRSVEDRRVVYVLPTAKGRALNAEVTPHVDVINSRLAQAVTAEEWAAMELTLSRIAKHVSTKQLDDVSNG